MSLNERAIFISQQLSQCNPASLKPDDVKEISSLLQQFATSQSSSNSSSSLSVSAPRSPDVKIRHPEYFHGQRKQLGEFLSQVMMVIETQPANFASDKTKVLYLCSHLRGSAYSWAQSYIETLRTPSEHPCLSNFDDFVKMLRAAFGDPDPRATARRDLFRLHQGNSSAADYAAAFQRAAVRTKWNSEALKDIFDEGLNDELRRELSTRDLPDNFVDYVPKVIALDNQMREFRLQSAQGGKKFAPNFQDRSNFHRSNFSNRPYYSHPRSPPPERKPFSRPVSSSNESSNSHSTPMEIGTISSKQFSSLTPEERKRRLDLKLCLYCGQPGHQANVCPNKLNSNRQTPKKMKSQY